MSRAGIDTPAEAAGDFMSWLVPWVVIVPAVSRGLWAVRLLRAGHQRRYPALLASLVLLAASELLALVLYGRGGNSFSYVYGFWVAFQMAAWSIGALALLEAASRSVEGYVEFRRIAERIVRGGLVAAGVVVGGWMLLASPERVASFGQFFNSHTRITLSCLALLGAAMWTFTAVARLRLTANASLTLRILTFQFAGSAALGWDLLPGGAMSAFLAGVVWATGCNSVGAVAWRTAEERLLSPDRRPRTTGSDDARRALAALHIENERLKDALDRE